MTNTERSSSYGNPGHVRTVGVVGTGSVGSSWITARSALRIAVTARASTHLETPEGRSAP